MIRNYCDKDLEECRKLWRELTEHHRDIYQDSKIGGDTPEDYFDEHLDKIGATNIFVYELDNKVIGFYGTIYKEEEVEIEPLVISKEFRGKKIGQEMVRHAVYNAKINKMRFICVKPLARNLEAINFYYKEGFDTLGAIEMLIDLKENENDYWKNGFDISKFDFNY
ncbi:GNAT superfamily N-acetyltransferase [Acetoanaerobium pronyense]|uniref:GNAT superfamily N-acetyltransferase n=1 Tax=Acetoanaerobium pronyense TaxID=1482736 RepID=A0ABS4KNE9_9FIRM|nr:GNAT family N-acetyltransferase [Acetoanaerobium pronyense]MBP2028666.1 GNAT superfamily N-acetyltransferase [Acetoanaerobium pronyense]